MSHSLRTHIDSHTYADQSAVLENLVSQAALSQADRHTISDAAAQLVRDIRSSTSPGLMEVFLAEYGLSTDEGVALMCLAEALLRVPDADTIDALIEDKIAPSDWGKHLGHSSSSLVNASTWALMLTGKVLDEGKTSPVSALRGAIKRLGEPVIRTAVGRAMKEMGRQFVLGETIQSAMDRASGMEAKGYTYSYDMLGEAARTEADAARYHLSYSRAIAAIAEACTHDDIRANPGISVKLSALHPRYELAQENRVMEELVPRLRALALLAKAAGMGLNVDAEEADRLSLSLQVIEAVMSEPALAGWDGFGIVVQAYGPRADLVLDTLYQMAEKHDRKLMVRLVKGAYWDTEIKRAQVEGVAGFPVFTQKAATDVSYIANARNLLGMTDRIYPQFATHNAHTVSAILHMADNQPFEFQRLHGMGETLHQIVKDKQNTRCRIYAPVGAHRDLLAYLVRRLLENGANSSFVNQIVDENVPPVEVASDPFEAIAEPAKPLPTGPELFEPERVNSKGFDLQHTPTLDMIDAARDRFRAHHWYAQPLLSDNAQPEADQAVINPAHPQDRPGAVAPASAEDVELALASASPWQAPAADRKRILNAAADLYEENFGELFALLSREAGKSLPDAIAELREAVDFLRYYAANIPGAKPSGIFTCISPWNFPLAIFTGQISAALATGNAVLAKPAPQTPLIGHRAVQLMHEAGVPRDALQLLPGGPAVGAALTSDSRVSGVAFTGSTATALKIRSAMAENLRPGTPLIAETGGLNAMIVDSTALPEQAVQSIIESAFQSAGQRCSALRCLYLQEDIADDVLTMLQGAMDALSVGDPWLISTDCGPVIDQTALQGIADHVAKARAEGRVLKELSTPPEGTFIAPALIEVSGIAALEREIFGPVLHVARFKAQDIDKVIGDINATDYGLTFGLHTRIDDRVQHVTEAIHAGNIYVNRNQIGAIVGSQPFGGEGLSGTGPKAGGPNYMARFCAPNRQVVSEDWTDSADLPEPEGQPAGITTQSLPGPTGESNRLSEYPRPPVLCLGPGPDAAQAQADAVKALGGSAIRATGALDLHRLENLTDFSGVMWWGDETTGREIERHLSRRDGPILPLIPGMPDRARVLAERHVCVDTTAAGGNAALLGGAA
ncbi:bifunctional proline dehydrogenase/L-glutamate gamma-semialdehyde dehydrogenase PutA [Roseibium sp. RKSG952]|uniref:bifunctional proline dehydrogenase/L-glutamate gamma-semialdehyde dehydrogenase PutA n=1 Tax=Roseibium sp. RKSG952 TaxID=2529384 RepID=UPI0012BCFAE7|nr:bifunctional proline dehydrogenase/L-glutamate gamma-semialdehyde dehydrogenase PutA [Roseibium sp. RKSG952]MTI00753.1 bifunctional proline dehydrogenase/L-glutamate gamma-semialdehyde dehydrogenase PutA [Roseibium sp. RKSG952]